MLSGPGINPVQFYCNVLLDTAALLKQAKRDDRELRLAFMASGLFEDPADLFEELQDIVTDDTAEIADTTDSDGEPIKTRFDFTHAELNRSQAEVEEEIRQMLAAAAEGSASFETPDYDDWI